MWVGPPSALVGFKARSIGYGINKYDNKCGSDMSTEGAGTARYADGFFIQTASDPFAGLQGGFYGLTNPNNPNSMQRLICGDSGGPDFTLIGGTWTGISVHSTGIDENPAISTSTNTFAQDALGGVFLSSAGAPNMNVAVNQSTFAVSLHDDLTAPTGSALHFDPETHRISLQGQSRCLTPGSPVSMSATCSTAANQRWTLAGDGRIISNFASTCLTVSGTNVVTTTCANGLTVEANQFWTFHPQIRDPARTLYPFCANENQTCSNSFGTREIRYGANGQYAYKLVGSNVACTNAVFGDPAPGVAKQCSIGLSGYNYCSAENGTCTFFGAHVVAYGANGTYVFRDLKNGTPCTNDAFHGDPVPGVPKNCFVR
jgi:hypothetical protein